MAEIGVRCENFGRADSLTEAKGQLNLQACAKEK